MRPTKERTTGKHIGFGKVILFGEHFVVHGANAIVAGISEYTECKVELLRGVPGVEVVDKRPAVPGYISEKRPEQEKAHQLVLDHLKISTGTDGLRIHLGGPLVPSSGIGASASDVVALSRALNELYDLHLNEAAINQSAFVGEGGYHGTPSGVDNTAATYGGLISFRRVNSKAVFKSVPLHTPLYLVVVSTGITASTTKVVGDVRKQKEENPIAFADLMLRYAQIVQEAISALSEGRLERVGQLMNANHELCRKINISCQELESIVNTCRQCGALGAKLSGTGRGGIAVALASSEQQQHDITQELQRSCSAAKFIWKYTVAPKTSNL